MNWHYKKPVIFFDISDGLLKRFNKDELAIGEEIIKQELPEADFRDLIQFLGN